MSHKIKENMMELRGEIKKLCEEPVTYRSAERLAVCHKAYKIMCELYGQRERAAEHEEAWSEDDSEPEVQVPHFDRQMAMAWTSGMVNADGTKGPHWTMEETNRLHKQYSLDCSPEEFWAVMNSLYSDYCEALRESSASTPEVYVRMAKAWIKDKDAVADKAAAYYTYIVKH